MPADSLIIDFDDTQQRKVFNGYVRSLQGPHRVKIAKVMRHRTLPQNAWYWGCVLPAVVNGLEECWGEKLTAEDAHEWLKAKFNSETIVNRKTGEVVDHRPCSTASLDVQEFSEYLDKVIRFAGEQLRVEVPQPCTV